MQREIKFRAYDKETGKMHYLINKPHNPETVDDELIVQIDCTGARGYTKNKYIGDCLMQFTGFKDKDDKEIYEGDIVEFDEIEWGGKDNIHIVSWDEEEGSWCWGGGCAGDMEFRRVIGNIYEHEHLLK
jgi:uncharacterized phage protein (TIGR01671 family)